MPNLSRNAARVGLSFAVVAGAIGVVSSPAFAATSGGCLRAAQACLWEDNGFGGSTYGQKSAIGKYELGGFNGDNEISSVVNYTPYCLNLYNGDNQTGSAITIWKYTGTNQSYYDVTIDDLGDKGFNNKAESWELFRC